MSVSACVCVCVCVWVCMCLCMCLCVRVFMYPNPVPSHLACDEQVFALDCPVFDLGLDRGPDFGFIAVGEGAVNVAISTGNGIFHSLGDFAGFRLWKKCNRNRLVSLILSTSFAVPISEASDFCRLPPVATGYTKFTSVCHRPRSVSEVIKLSESSLCYGGQRLRRVEKCMEAVNGVLPWLMHG